MLAKDPAQRPRIAEVLTGPFFSTFAVVSDSVTTPSHWELVHTRAESTNFHDVTEALRAAVQPLLDSAGFRVKKISRVENSRLWVAYFQERQRVIRALAARLNWHLAADKLPTTLRAALPNTDELLTDEAGEVLLLHGTSAAGSIALHGFDQRLANQTRNFYGMGIYFAEDAPKCAQYLAGAKTMFLSRVVLGHSFCTEENKFQEGAGTIRFAARAPCTEGGHRDTEQICGHPRHHSVVANPVGHSPYREFIVYNGHQAYPEYLIEFE
jgi:hypothetical protein